jgi:hypothetical protein
VGEIMIKKICGIYIDKCNRIEKINTEIIKEDMHLLITENGEVLDNIFEHSLWDYSTYKGDWRVRPYEIRDMMYLLAKMGGNPDWDAFKNRSLEELMKELKPNKIKIEFKEIITKGV